MIYTTIMINIILFLEFVLYISTLIAAFKIESKNKKKLEKNYEKYKKVILILIFGIFLTSFMIMLKAYLLTGKLLIWLILNFLFIIYFSAFHQKKSRCWRQHRMIIYNFCLIPIIYYASLLIGVISLNVVVFLIMIYNLVEFQYAKVNFKKGIFWN